MNVPLSVDQVIDLHALCRAAIFKHVGYVEDWVVLPFDDQRTCFWRVTGEGPNAEVFWAKAEAELLTRGGSCYSGELYTQRFLPKWVYRGSAVTMVLVDTHTDGNRFLMLFDNTKERSL